MTWEPASECEAGLPKLLSSLWPISPTLTTAVLSAGSRIMADVGTEAPEFSLKSHDGRAVSSSDYRGVKWLVISAYPFAFTGG